MKNQETKFTDEVTDQAKRLGFSTSAVYSPESRGTEFRFLKEEFFVNFFVADEEFRNKDLASLIREHFEPPFIQMEATTK